MGRQLEFGYEYGVTKEQACILCHIAADCEGCCSKCEHRRNGACAGTTCVQLTREEDGGRWETEMRRVNGAFKSLRRHVPEKWLKEWKKHNRN